MAWRKCDDASSPSIGRAAGQSKCILSGRLIVTSRGRRSKFTSGKSQDKHDNINTLIELHERLIHHIARGSMSSLFVVLCSLFFVYTIEGCANVIEAAKNIMIIRLVTLSSLLLIDTIERESWINQMRSSCKWTLLTTMSIIIIIDWY